MRHQSIFVYCFQTSLQISLTVEQKIFLTPHIQSWWQTDVSQRCQTGLESKSLVWTSDVSRPEFWLQLQSSSMKIRRDLHCLPCGHRTTYKLCLTTWKTRNTSQPLWTHFSPSSVQILAFFQYKSPYQTTRYYKQLFLSGLFGVCTFYLELSTCMQSFYRHPIHL